jgi:AraC family transcriptional activator of pobA
MKTGNDKYCGTVPESKIRESHIILFCRTFTQKIINPLIELMPLEACPELKTPRRLMRYVLIWCSEGEAILGVDEHEFVLTKHQLITITSGQVHFLKRCKGGKGRVLEFTYDFFCKTDADIELIFHNGLFCHFAMNEVVTVKDSTTVEKLLDQIKQDLSDKPYQYLISAHACLELLLVAINRAKIERGDEIWKPDVFFLKFLELVRANFRCNYPVSYYAETLQTTEGKLNEQSKLHTGKTAQNVIYGLITSEAKRLLTYENLSVKAVAFELGFNDPFYFSNFFKKHSGISPKAYKNAVFF